MIRRLSLTAASCAFILVAAVAAASAVRHWVQLELTDADFSALVTPTAN